MARVGLEHIWKRYGDVVAVHDVSLEAKDEEFLVLVGPSGCGKSTTLRMIAGLDDISDGSISIGDRVVNDLSPKDRDIAMVFQSYALYPHMNVYDNMAFGLKLRKTPKPEIKRRVNEAGEILGITQSTRPKTEAAFRWSASARRVGPCDRPPTRPSFSWTSRSPTLTQNCASRLALRSASSISGSRPRSSTSRTTKPKR